MGSENKNGWLVKKGKKRWFLLTNADGVLYWFNKEQQPLPADFKKKANGSLQLGKQVSVRLEESSSGKKFGIYISGILSFRPNRK